MMQAMRAERPERTVTPERFRDGMARFGSAVSVVTTSSCAGPVGFTATAVCSVSDTPATLLVCINRSASAYPAFSRAEGLCVNVLAASQTPIGVAFGGKVPMASRFALGEWTSLSTGSPVLDGASAALDCRIVERQALGTHDIAFCEVIAVRLGDEPSSLVYFDRRFHALEGEAQGV